MDKQTLSNSWDYYISFDKAGKLYWINRYSETTEELELVTAYTTLEAAKAYCSHNHILLRSWC